MQWINSGGVQIVRSCGFQVLRQGLWFGPKSRWFCSPRNSKLWIDPRRPGPERDGAGAKPTAFGLLLKSRETRGGVDEVTSRNSHLLIRIVLNLIWQPVRFPAWPHSHDAAGTDDMDDHLARI
jgi:hypothetical protein